MFLRSVGVELGLTVKEVFVIQ